jgi:SAM-dependent methyltransferase
MISQTMLSITPSLYLACQYLIGAHRLRRICVDQLGLRSGERVADIGCGPAYLCRYLPAGVHYVGFDPDQRYVTHAKARYGGQFHCGFYGNSEKDRLGPFDAILLMGVLHHLDNREASELLGVIGAPLAPGGRVVTLDPCLQAGQSRIARFMAANDPGKHVRDERGYRALGAGFGSVESVVMSNVCRIPTTELVMTLRADSVPVARPQST